MKRTAPESDTSVSNLAILYEYVRQSGLYNMLWPIEEARMAAAAILATGVYLGQPIDWDFLVTTPQWPSLVQQEFKHSASKLAAAARALPGGDDYIKAARHRSEFLVPSGRTRLTCREIVQEAVDECLRWAIYASEQEQSVPVQGYRAVTYGAQCLDVEKTLAPPRTEKRPKLGALYVTLNQK